MVHGPKPRDFSMGVNKKVMAGALRSALSLRAQAGNLVVIKDFTGDKPKTKTLAETLVKAEAPKALIVDDAGNDWLARSARNLETANFIADGGLNVYDILKHPKLLISEQSLRKLESRLGAAKAEG